MGQGPLTFDVGVRADKYMVTAFEAGRILTQMGVSPDEIPEKLKNLIAQESQVRAGTVRSRPRHRAASKTRRKERIHKKRTIAETEDTVEDTK